jgi:pentatricopeptide repeat domain-containing protein 1
MRWRRQRILLSLLVSVCCCTPTDAFLVHQKRRSFAPRIAADAIRIRSSTTLLVSRTESGTSSSPQQQQKQQPRRPADPRRNDNSSSTAESDTERMIVSAGRQGRTDAALDLFYSIPRPTIRQVNAVIDACARARPVRLSTAFEIFENYTAGTATHLRPNVYTYGALMNAVSRAGEVEIAVQLLDTMESAVSTSAMGAVVVRPNAVVYQSAITAAANADPARPDIALQLLERAKKTANITLTVVGYNAAITAASRAADGKLAVDLLRVMQSDDTVPNPDAVTYGTVMAACENCGEWNQVLQLCADMQACGLQMDGMAITSALHACQQLGLAEEAVQYLELMKTVDQRDNRHTAGRERIGSRQLLQGPDAVAYRLAVSACARGGAWQEGIRLLDELCEQSDNSKDVMAYTAAITGCEYAGKWLEAVQLLGRMRATGVEPNEVTFAAVIGACATACANLSLKSDSKKDPNEIPIPQRKALQILNVMKKDPTVVDPNIQVYNAAMRACAEGLDVSRAFQLLQMLREEGLTPNIVTYGTLMTACQRVGSMSCLSKVFKLMKEDGLEPNGIIYGAALSCCRKAGEGERAFLLLRKMIRDGVEPNVATFNTVLIAQTEARSVTAKDIERGVLVFKTLIGNDTVATPNRNSYSILIRALAANKRPQDAEALLRRMRENNMTPDVDLYTATVSSYERAGQPLNALRLMESMREDGYDFYEAEVLNTLFKRVVKLVNAVGQSLTSKGNEFDIDTNPLFRNETSIAPI